MIIQRSEGVHYLVSTADQSTGPGDAHVCWPNNRQIERTVVAVEDGAVCILSGGNDIEPATWFNFDSPFSGSTASRRSDKCASGSGTLMEERLLVFILKPSIPPPKSDTRPPALPFHSILLLRATAKTIHHSTRHDSQPSKPSSRANPNTPPSPLLWAGGPPTRT